jgi:hypothetical protein
MGPHGSFQPSVGPMVWGRLYVRVMMGYMCPRKMLGWGGWFRPEIPRAPVLSLLRRPTAAPSAMGASSARRGGRDAASAPWGDTSADLERPLLAAVDGWAGPEEQGDAASCRRAREREWAPGAGIREGGSPDARALAPPRTPNSANGRAQAMRLVGTPKRSSRLTAGA